MGKKDEKEPQPHQHDYVATRTQPAQDGTGRTVYHLECVNPGCPGPTNKMEVR